MRKVWAFDIGASNGRLMVNSFDGKQLHIEEIHRFSNYPVQLMGHYYWDILRIYQEMKYGMSKSLQMGHTEIESLSIDTWGVDFGILSKSGELLGNPYCYRDRQSNKSMAQIDLIISKQELFNRTGVEPSSINTIYQLHAICQRNQKLTDQAENILLTPNLLGYLLSGVKVNEYTISTTTSLYNIQDCNWDKQLMEKLNLPYTLMGEIVKTGTNLGKTLESINREIGLQKSVNVIAGPGHDTACALAALPIKNNQSAFMSCGTWVLIGIETEQPIVNNQAFQWGFTNEGTADGRNRLLKNTMGLWLIQASKAEWAKKGIEISYENEVQLIGGAKPFQRFIDPDHSSFFNPENMPKEIHAYCHNTNQQPPEYIGDYLRCILESVALKYREIIEKLERLTGYAIKVIHMGGGGIRNEFLCQFTANATNRTVIAGPVESSSIGNGLSQWISLGEIKDYNEGREIVANSFPIKIYEPENQAAWEEAYFSYKTITWGEVVYENDRK